MQLASRADVGVRDSSGAARSRKLPTFFGRAPGHLHARVTAVPIGAFTWRAAHALLARLRCSARSAARHAPGCCC